MTSPASPPAERPIVIPEGKPEDDVAMIQARAMSADMKTHGEVSPGKPYGLGRAARVLRAVLTAKMPAPAKAAKRVAATTPPAPKPDRPRDPIFDAIALASGMDLAEITKPAGGEIAAAKAAILAVTPDVTPAEIKRRAAKLAAKWTGVSVTPSSLAKHWGEFSAGAKKHQDKPAPEVAPAGWVAKLHRIYPDSVYVKGGAFEIKEPGTDYEWSQLPQVIRNTIKGAKP